MSSEQAEPESSPTSSPSAPPIQVILERKDLVRLIAGETLHFECGTRIDLSVGPRLAPADLAEIVTEAFDDVQRRDMPKPGLRMTKR
jgi:hypothetical protein